jgi:hypothetical protein
MTDDARNHEREDYLLSSRHLTFVPSVTDSFVQRGSNITKPQILVIAHLHVTFMHHI